MAITPTRIDNRLGTIASSPVATTNAGPVAGDIGFGLNVLPSNLCRIFDITVSSGGPDSLQINLPAALQQQIGLDIKIIATNAAAVTAGIPFVTQAAQLFTLTWAGAVTAGTYRITVDARHTIGR